MEVFQDYSRIISVLSINGFIVFLFSLKLKYFFAKYLNVQYHHIQ